ncbi:MAG: DUF420 domain-containing protein [Candidatus Omnitrophica bacterium]|nr:DUF420 domain-containing protein [Candidatus Omnitrophota bacterium]
MNLSILPSLNAALNTASALLLILGYIFIRQRALTAHTMAMMAACGTSTLFLISYLTYHYYHGSEHFQGQGWIRPVYFTILITHTILAVVIVPLAITTVIRGFRSQFPKHMKIARITLPIWLYVSVTGVVIYWMLYHAYANPSH